MLIDQFPASQLGQEPQVLQLLKSGDIDFAITSTGDASRQATGCPDYPPTKLASGCVPI
jgi:TRAP-type C4-dicarboxylate transport system substrate-binding protein